MAYKTRPGETQHQARERIARAKGFASYRGYRTAGVQRRTAATGALAARDPGYRERAKGALRTIETRRRARGITTPAGTVITTTSPRRLRAAVRDATGPVDFTVTVSLGGIDRRRRDPRRAHGRDTAVRTVRFTVYPGEADTDTVADFADWLDDAIDDAIDELYAGSSGNAAVQSISVVVPMGRAA